MKIIHIIFAVGLISAFNSNAFAADTTQKASVAATTKTASKSESSSSSKSSSSNAAMKSK